MCDVALSVCDVVLRVFDGEQSVLRTQVCNTQLPTPVSKILGKVSWIQNGPVSLSMVVVLDY